MVGEVLIDLFLDMFSVLFGALQVLTIPVDLIGVLSTILCYGVWIVGGDVLAIFVGSVVFWWGVHLSIGLAVWVWERLPLT